MAQTPDKLEQIHIANKGAFARKSTLLILENVAL